MASWTNAFEASPADSDDASEGAERIRELKVGIQERIVHEHDFDTSSGAVANHGWHKAGAAKGYYQADEPTNRPDGTTSLTSDDAGRYWTDTDDGKIYVYSGSAWTALTIGSGATDELASLTASEVQQLQNIGTTTLSTAIWEQVGNIGSVTISATQWGYLGDLDQALTTTDDVTFADGTFSGSLDVSNGIVNPNKLFDNNVTENEIFDELSSYIPNNDDTMALYGGIVISSSSTHVYAYAIRTTSSQVTLMGVDTAGSRVSQPARDGNTSTFIGVALAW
jgi:hypothetical protein